MGRLDREFSSGGIVIRRRGARIKVLLIRDPYGNWTWPKGKIDGKETPLEAAKREIKEETGLGNIRMISEIGRTNYYYRRSKRLIYKTVYFYLFESVGDEPLAIQKSEIADGAWFAERNALLKVGYKGARELLKKALTLYKETT